VIETGWTTNAARRSDTPINAFRLRFCRKRTGFWAGMAQNKAVFGNTMRERSCVPASAGSRIESPVIVWEFSPFALYPASPGRRDSGPFCDCEGEGGG
jgi:hypothetical protein